MTQFHLHVNASPNAAPGIPFLLDLQSPLLSTLRTRIVAPVFRRSHFVGSMLADLILEVAVNGEACVVVLPELAAIPEKYLGETKLDLSSDRARWIRALDILITGL